MYVFSKSCGVENSTVVIQLMLEAFSVKTTTAEVPEDWRMLTVQLPPLRQGFPAHSLTWVSQLAPVKPGLQEQV